MALVRFHAAGFTEICAELTRRFPVPGVPALPLDRTVSSMGGWNSGAGDDWAAATVSKPPAASRAPVSSRTAPAIGVATFFGDNCEAGLNPAAPAETAA